MNRINRISAILIKLQSQRVVKAKDIAEMFSISLRTVYRDIRTLEEAGIPILSEAGVGYSIVKGYFLPPVAFTHDEAVALLTAQKFVEKMADKSTHSAYANAMIKIKAVLKLPDKDSLEHLGPRIEVFKRKQDSIPLDDDTFQTVLKSISDNLISTITYNAGNAGELSERNVEPIGVLFSDDQWYMIAFCHLRNDYRTFRLDRIKQIALTNHTFKIDHPTLKDYLQQVSKSKQLETIVISFDNSVVKYTDRQKYYFGFVNSETMDNKTTMTFLTNQIDEMSHWLLMFIDQIEIISPEMLSQKVKTLVSKLQSYYQ